MSRTAAGQPLVALRIRAAASRVASRGTTSAGRSVATSVSISSVVNASAAPPMSETSPWARRRSTPNGGSLRETRSTWRLSGANRTSASTNRHEPVAPSISWVSSSTSSSSSSQASWSASATSVAAAWPRCCASASSRGSTAVAIGVARSSGSASARRRSVATTPAANVPRWRSIASTVYQAVFRVRATRAARVLFPNPAPATMIVSRRSVPAASRASSSGRSRVPLGSRGGTSLAARLMPIAGGRVAAVGAVLRSSAVPSGIASAW